MRGPATPRGTSAGRSPGGVALRRPSRLPLLRGFRKRLGRERFSDAEANVRPQRRQKLILENHLLGFPVAPDDHDNLRSVEVIVAIEAIHRLAAHGTLR